MTLSISSVLPNASQLPSNYLVALTDFSAISLTGEDQSTYLQGQVTCDVNSVTDSSLSIGAHCDAKGKVLSVFRLINRLSSHLLLQPKSSIEKSLTALKKFGVFAKVEIEQSSDLHFYALVGDKASSLLQQHFRQVPDSLTPVIQVGSTTCVYLAGQSEHYLLIDEAVPLHDKVALFDLPIFSHALWQLVEINEGFPLLEKSSIEQYVPQMLNLQAINGISFTKGCYLGQETVARMQYLGRNKRALYALSAQAEVTVKINAGDIIEQQLGENWRKAGDVLTSYQADDLSLAVQAVLSSDIGQQTKLRLKKTPEVMFSITELPYSIEQK